MTPLDTKKITRAPDIEKSHFKEVLNHSSVLA